LCQRNLDKKQEEQVYLEALIKLFDYSGKTLEDKEYDKKAMKKSASLGQITDEYIMFFDQQIKGINNTDGKFNDEEYKRLYDTAKNDFNIMYVGLNFLKNCRKSYNIRIELNSLIENLQDKERDNWRSTIYEQKA